MGFTTMKFKDIEVTKRVIKDSNINIEVRLVTVKLIAMGYMENVASQPALNVQLGYTLINPMFWPSYLRPQLYATTP